MVLLIQIKNQRMKYHFRPIYIKMPVLIKMHFSCICKNNFILILFNFNGFSPTLTLKTLKELKI